MKTYKITYKGGANYSNLPTSIEADSYVTRGRFVDFVKHGDHMTSGPSTLHRIAAEGVVHIELQQGEGENE